ncbi:NAD(P)/FAD-dependent oxidoreductase [Pseudonocardia sp. GCM10023141]|uniref:NAD(P)/FAD-dependent oxidoreductase n=1 Tax=Pseudonocardia sp. GCM10023141 TaxID=3252653 RepID=UPI00361905CD
MSDVLIIGGGFAGVWAAAGMQRTAREAGVGADELRVTLVAAGDDIVIRPRLYESGPEQMRVSLDRILGPIGVRRIAATVTGIDTAARQVTAIGRDGLPSVLHYDRLVLAAGSQVVRPELPGAEHLFDVDTMTGAAGLAGHLDRLPRRAAEGATGGDTFTAVVVGAGFTGIEVATELVGRLRAIAGATTPVRVVLVERADAVGPELGPGPRPEILAALDELGVELRLGVSLTAVTPTGVTLSDGTTIAAATTIWTAGMLASPLTAQVPGRRDRLGRLHVDEHLRVEGVADVYAAGDTAAAQAEDGHHVTQSCQHAVPQGKFVGRNVAADLLGLPAVPFVPDPYVTCLDLGAAGAVLTSGFERSVVMTRDEAKDLKRSINAQWIYPPVDDGEHILDRADHRQTWPTAETVSGAAL